MGPPVLGLAAAVAGGACARTPSPLQTGGARLPRPWLDAAPRGLSVRAADPSTSNGAARRSFALATGVRKATAAKPLERPPPPHPPPSPPPQPQKQQQQQQPLSRQRHGTSADPLLEGVARDNADDPNGKDLPRPASYLTAGASSSGGGGGGSIPRDALAVIRQQLETQAGDSKGYFDKPLVADEAARLRQKFRERRNKGLEDLRGRLSKQRGEEIRPSSEGGGEISYAVDPEKLIPGEFVVHKRVGIGKFVCVKSEVPAGKGKPVKMLYIKYADGMAKLRAKQAHRLLYRFRSPGERGRAPALSKLSDTSSWEKRKNKGKVAIQRLVVDMMELYVHRLKQRRPPYQKHAKAMVSFAASFPYSPTPDQAQAFVDVEGDMTDRDTPMDRLICGDVGFGKTEVAMRAIYRAILDRRQVMVLAPTTVLAKQHFHTISERMLPHGDVQVRLLSRFQKESERREVIKGIQDGSLHVVVGTHALLGSQIRYHNLGLLVVDEEQRFGVRQKEKITSLKTTVDVLTLSATPIPRTLHMALNGFRDASLITTPPPERRPIRTHLHEFSWDKVKEAIQAELDRKGQIFYVVPRIKGIEETRARLEAQFENVSIAVAHGQQSSEELEEAMEEFSEGKTDMLLCTSIIESGLDISTVNTIVIEDIHLFGLAQLYQLRGRVGRADQEAHAYMFHPPKDLLTDEALERLVALEECCGLGQGFQLAERDMAIRGIGNVFGEKQSGDMAKIGVDLYLEMLYEGLSKVEQQNLPRLNFEDVKLDIEVDSHIPSEYIPDLAMREKVVQDAEKAAGEGMRALMLFTDRLRDNFGREPLSVEMLLKTLYVRRIAADLGIGHISVKGKTIIMGTEMEDEAFEMLSNAMESDSLRGFLSYHDGRIELQGLIGLPPDRQLERVFSCLADMRNGLPSFIHLKDAWASLVAGGPSSLRAEPEEGVKEARARWGISFANIADFAKPPEKISLPQQCAVTATGVIWSRYSMVIIPKNWNLLSVNVFMAGTGLYQLQRKLMYEYGGGKDATPATQLNV
eukprot:SM000080S22909  [mRNA]  locus=s80:26269:33483:+ [translate_table: standard]